jgi:hypothetical protein
MSYTKRYCVYLDLTKRYGFFLDLSYAHYPFQLKNQLVIGGPNIIVKMDESLFIWRKKEVERGLPQQWVLGGTCRGTREILLIAIRDPPGQTLVSVI